MKETTDSVTFDPISRTATVPRIDTKKKLAMGIARLSGPYMAPKISPKDT